MLVLEKRNFVVKRKRRNVSDVSPFKIFKNFSKVLLTKKIMIWFLKSKS